MWKHIAANALTFIIVGLFLLGGLIIWGTREYSAPGPLAQAICLKVDSGATMSTVATSLSEHGAIKSRQILRIAADYSGKAGDLKAGSFLVPANASMEEVLDIVTRGGRNTCGTAIVYSIGVRGNDVVVRELDPATNRFVEMAKFDPATEATPEIYTELRADADTQYTIAVAEGVTSWQVITGLNGIEALGDDMTDIPAEGTLAPNSYAFVPGDPVAKIVTIMESAQAQILAEAWAERAEDLPVTSPEEALILASIVEKETGLPDERAQVASVFVNRLRQGMKLQTDPTVIYGITNGEGILDRGLRQSELRAVTPYNTYIIDGLPPTPIANPGKAAIEAALHPADTNFIFFVADGTGGHAFADNLRDHNNNVAAWRAIEAQGGN